MKIELKNENIIEIIDAENLESGTLGLFRSKYDDIPFKAILIRNIDDETPILFDIENDVYYGDVYNNNYSLVKKYNNFKMVIE